MRSETKKDGINGGIKARDKSLVIVQQDFAYANIADHLECIRPEMPVLA